MIYAHDDDSKWGIHFLFAASRHNVPCQLFKSPKEVPDNSVAFVRLDQRENQREIGKKIVSELWKRRIRSVPNSFEADLYDDKARQAAVLQDWMPKTYYIKDLKEALLATDKMNYPLVSKSKDGSSSKAVRLLESKGHAEREARNAFGPGIRSVYNRIQRGYVIWQEFVPNCDCDYRVVITNDRIFGLKRYVRPDRPFASGSGLFDPVKEMKGDALKCFGKAVEISQTIQTKWMAYDFVMKDGEPMVLEMSSSWSLAAYAECPMFNLSLKKTTWRGGHMFDCAVQLCQDIS